MFRTSRPGGLQKYLFCSSHIARTMVLFCHSSGASAPSRHLKCYDFAAAMPIQILQLGRIVGHRAQGFGCSALRSNIRSNVHSDIGARTVAPLSQVRAVRRLACCGGPGGGHGPGLSLPAWRLFSAAVGFWIGLRVSGAMGSEFGVVAPMLVELVRQPVEVLF